MERLGCGCARSLSPVVFNSVCHLLLLTQSQSSPTLDWVGHCTEFYWQVQQTFFFLSKYKRRKSGLAMRDYYSPALATDMSLATTYIMITTIIHVTYKTSLRSTTRFIPYFGFYELCYLPTQGIIFVVDLRLVLYVT